jgi:hypothetical protein
MLLRQTPNYLLWKLDQMLKEQLSLREQLQDKELIALIQRAMAEVRKQTSKPGK